MCDLRRKELSCKKLLSLFTNQSLCLSNLDSSMTGLSAHQNSREKYIIMYHEYWCITNQGFGLSAT